MKTILLVLASLLSSANALADAPILGTLTSPDEIVTFLRVGGLKNSKYIVDEKCIQKFLTHNTNLAFMTVGIAVSKITVGCSMFGPDAECINPYISATYLKDTPSMTQICAGEIRPGK